METFLCCPCQYTQDCIQVLTDSKYDGIHADEASKQRSITA